MRRTVSPVSSKFFDHMNPTEHMKSPEGWRAGGPRPCEGGLRDLTLSCCACVSQQGDARIGFLGNTLELPLPFPPRAVSPLPP